jgi:hypothetical protein
MRTADSPKAMAGAPVPGITSARSSTRRPTVATLVATAAGRVDPAAAQKAMVVAITSIAGTVARGSRPATARHSSMSVNGSHGGGRPCTATERWLATLAARARTNTGGPIHQWNSTPAATDRTVTPT